MGPTWRDDWVGGLRRREKVDESWKKGQKRREQQRRIQQLRKQEVVG